MGFQKRQRFRMAFISQHKSHNERLVGSNPYRPFLFSAYKKAVSTSLNLPHRGTTPQVDKRMGQVAQSALWPELTGCRTSDKMRLGKGEIPDDDNR